MKRLPPRLSRRARICAYLISISVHLLLLAQAEAQLYTGSITGLVQEPSGAVIPRASVVLTDVDNAVKYSTTTDSSGRYVLRALPPSTYNMRVEDSGFRTVVHSGIIIVVDKTMTLT